MIVLLSMMIVFQSCSKQSINQVIAPVSPNVINAVIAPNQSYVLNVNGTGNISIETQALHYKVSKASPDAKNGQMVYEYLPAQDYTGKDEVVLSKKITIYSSYSSGSGGGCHSNSNYDNNSVTTSYSTSYTTIRFTIAN